MPGPQDKTTTIQAATAVIGAIQVNRVGASLQAIIYGSVTLSDGTTMSKPFTYILSGAADTAVRNFMDGAALTKWRTDNGIEAP